MRVHSRRIGWQGLREQHEVSLRQVLTQVGPSLAGGNTPGRWGQARQVLTRLQPAAHSLFCFVRACNVRVGVCMCMCIGVRTHVTSSFEAALGFRVRLHQFFVKAT